MKCVALACSMLLAACSGASSSVDESVDANAGETAPDVAVADSSSAFDAATEPSVDALADAGSRCTVTDTTVFCTHNVTSVKGKPTDARDVYWQTPLTATPAAGFPAVVIYQGSFGGPAITWATLTKGAPFGGFYQGLLQARLLDSGFVVIGPSAAAGVAWDTNSGAKWEDTPDSVFIASLLAEIEKGTFGPVDMKHLYATGISSGGYMTSRMAVSYPGKFRALAVHSGSYATCLGPVCNVPAMLPEGHPPTLFLHGQVDTTVPIATMTPYHDRLVSQGLVADKIVDPSAGHEWLSVSPDRITAWFEAH